MSCRLASSPPSIPLHLSVFSISFSSAFLFLFLDIFIRRLFSPCCVLVRSLSFLERESPSSFSFLFLRRTCLSLVETSVSSYTNSCWPFSLFLSCLLLLSSPFLSLPLSFFLPFFFSSFSVFLCMFPLNGKSSKRRRARNKTERKKDS